MIRQLVTLASVLSLLLCMGTIVLWARSYRHVILFDFHRSDGLWEVSVRDGSLFMENQSALRFRTMRAEEQEALSLRERASGFRAQWQRRPDRFDKSKDNLVDQIVEIEARWQSAEKRYMSLNLQLHGELRRGKYRPIISHSIRCGMVAMAMLLQPLAWFIWVASARFRRIRLMRSGHCGFCGYDVRASKERCPKCGTAIVANAGLGVR